MAFELSKNLGLCSQGDCDRVIKHLDKVGAPKANQFDFEVSNLLHHMKGDKKMADGKLTFVMTRGIGKSFLSNDVEMNDVQSVLYDAIKG